jgi:hypothetical protein
MKQIFNKRMKKMPRIGHGGVVKSSAEITTAIAELDASTAANTHFGWMFSPSPDEQPPAAARLPDGPATIKALTQLGEAMAEAATDEKPPREDRIPADSREIPAGYTYFGQFIDHDITLVGDVFGLVDSIMSDDFPPLTTLKGVRNLRTPFLELDSVYGTPGVPGTPGNPVPAGDGSRMRVGPTHSVTNGTPRFLAVPGKGRLNDSPRKPRSSESPAIDREAMIGDPRNDENLIVGQLHVGFLKAHNTLADIMGGFDAARTALTQIYQSTVIDDFLPRICDEAILRSIEKDGPRLFKPSGPTFMPIEFAAAGFRFGHSMVRNKYNFNLNFPDDPAALAFTFTALSGQLGDFDTFPDNWIIQWPEFLSIHGSSPQRARPIDPRLAPLLFALPDVLGQPQQGNVSKILAIRNLRRAFLFALPTGQAMAERVGALPIAITPQTTGLPLGAISAFQDRTPLWLYVLTEAKLNNGKLGAVGSRIVAETLTTLVQRSTPSIFDSNGKRRFDARYKLADIINLAAIQDKDSPEPTPVGV